MRILSWFLWVSANFLCALAVGIAYRRRCLSRLPIFFSYLVFSPLLMFIYLFLVALGSIFTRIQALYGWFLVFSILANFSLEIAVIYELWNKVVLSRFSVTNVLRPLPRWSAAVLVLVITIFAALLPQNPPARVVQVYSTLDISANLLDLGLVFILVVVSRLMGAAWGLLPTGAALGIAIGDAGSAARSALMNQMGAHLFMDVIFEASSFLAAAVWLTYVVKSTKARAFRNAQLYLKEGIVASEQLSKQLGG